MDCLAIAVRPFPFLVAGDPLMWEVGEGRGSWRVARPFHASRLPRHGGETPKWEAWWWWERKTREREEEEERPGRRARPQ